jgi:large subunit ribosomal protein L1
VIHIAVGKASMDVAKLAENVGVLLTEVARKKTPDVKGNFVRSVSLSSTMGPGGWVNYKEAE